MQKAIISLFTRSDDRATVHVSHVRVSDCCDRKIFSHRVQVISVGFLRLVYNKRSYAIPRWRIAYSR